MYRMTDLLLYNLRCIFEYIFDSNVKLIFKYYNDYEIFKRQMTLCSMGAPLSPLIQVI